MNYIKSGKSTVTVEEYERFRIVKNLQGSVIGIKDTNDRFVFATPELRRIQANRKAAKARRDRDGVMRDMGLTKVYGAVSGRVY